MFKKYLKLCKLRVVFLMLITAAVGMMITPKQYHNPKIAAWGLIGIGILAAAGAAINHISDQDFDSFMSRTKKRPLVTGNISRTNAIIFTILLILSGTAVLIIFTNKLAAILTLSTMLGYGVIYTSWLKHITPQNIVIGGLSGALPPLLGWTCLTGTMGAEPWLLVLIIFAWTPPHFWALAIYKIDDYNKVNIPMLPVTHGIKYTRLNIMLYSILTVLTTYLPITISMFGVFYLIFATLINIYFLLSAYKLYKKQYSEKKFFWLSIYYLFLLFIFMTIDKWIFSNV